MAELLRLPRPLLMKITEIFAGRKYIGYQYLVVGVVFLAIGIAMTQLLRWHSSHPDAGKLSSKFYDFLSTSHGTILVFFGLIPVAFAAFGNLCMPLQPSGRMSWAPLNAAGLLLFYLGVISLLISIHNPLGGFWITAMIFNFGAWLACSLSFIPTIFVVSKSGRLSMPLFIWSLLLTAVLLFVALLLLEVAAIMQLVNFLNGSAVVTGSVQRSDVGDPASRLWHHLFWFLGHPEVYVLTLPMVGLLAELVRMCLRKIFRGNSESTF